MSKIQLKKFIEKQINKLNEKIDAKIVLGKDWSTDMVEHSKLLKKLNDLN